MGKNPVLWVTHDKGVEVKGRKCVETVTRAQTACDMASGKQSCVFGQGKVFFMEHYLEEALRTLVAA